MKIPVYCLRGSDVLQLRLDLRTVGRMEEIVEKVREFVRDLQAERLFYVYSDEDTPATNLKVIDEADMQAVQENAIIRASESAYFLYDETGKAENYRAIHFFQKVPEVQEPVPAEAEPAQDSIAEEANRGTDENGHAGLAEIMLPFSLAINKEESRVSIKKNDLVVLEESSALEPEYVKSGASLTRDWKLQVTGQPWQQASVALVQGSYNRTSFTLARQGDTLSLHLQLQVPPEGCDVTFRVAIDGDICGPLLWLTAQIKAEKSIEEQLIELGALERSLADLKQLYEFGLTDLQKLMRVWKKARTFGMEAVANIYWSEEAL